MSAHVRNANIPYSIVTVVENDGKLAPEPVHLSQLLKEVDLNNFFIELVSEQPSPLVKIKNKKDVYAIEKTRAKQLKTSRTVIKELQFSWAISMGDLQHKLAKAASYLDKGNRVDITFLPKANQPSLSRSERDRISGQIREGLRHVGKEGQPPRERYQELTMYFYPIQKQKEHNEKTAKPE